MSLEIKKPHVSIWMITYNHEKSIEKAIKSVLMQKTTFEFELIIGEDCSTDNTPSIINSYKSKYPNIIRARFNSANIGMSNNMIKTLEECNGKYIAMLEGDDYWTDEYKLQKQVEFLDANTHYSLCCHRYKILVNDQLEYDDYASPLLLNGLMSCEFTLEQNFKHWVTKPLTVMFRKDCLKIGELKQYQYARDIHLFYNLLSSKFSGYLMDFFGAVYTKNQHGVWTSQSTSQQVETSLNVYNDLLSKHKKSSALQKMYLESLKHYFRHSNNSIFSKRSYHIFASIFKLLPTSKWINAKYYILAGVFKNFLLNNHEEST